MTDFSALAQDAMKVLGPAIALAASAAFNRFSDGFLSEPGAKLFNWLSARLQGTPAENTLNRAVSEPEDPRRQQALQLEIEDLSRRDPSFWAELKSLLEDSTALTRDINSTQTVTQTGNSNKSVQAAGNDITIHLA